MTVGMLPGLEVVADEYRVEADLFRQAGEVEQFARAELLSRGLVSEFQHLSLLSCQTLASTSSRKRRILATTSSAVLPSKLKSTAITPRSRKARRSPITAALSPEPS